jgi:hypothetical protein
MANVRQLANSSNSNVFGINAAAPSCKASFSKLAQHDRALARALIMLSRPVELSQVMPSQLSLSVSAAKRTPGQRPSFAARSHVMFARLRTSQPEDTRPGH